MVAQGLISAVVQFLRVNARKIYVHTHVKLRDVEIHHKFPNTLIKKYWRFLDKFLKVYLGSRGPFSKYLI